MYFFMMCVKGHLPVQNYDFTDYLRILSVTIIAIAMTIVSQFLTSMLLAFT